MKRFAAATIAATLALGAVPASAAVLTPGTEWSIVGFGATGSDLTDGISGDNFWTVTLSEAGTLQVTDVLQIGDVFEIFVNGLSIGTSGSFNPGGDATLTDPNVAFGGDHSWLSYVLAPGDYTITGIVSTSPYSAGNGFIRVIDQVDGAVPEPATWAMMIAGFGLVGTVARRRKAVLA